MNAPTEMLIATVRQPRERRCHQATATAATATAARGGCPEGEGRSRRRGIGPELNRGLQRPISRQSQS
jgi:hypothetical protein